MAFIILFLLVIPFNSDAEEIIKKGEILNLQRCIEIALKKHPDIIASTNNVNAYINKVGQSRADYYPQINLYSGYSRISPVTSANGSYDNYSTGININQIIYDFGKTSTQVNIQNLNLNAVRTDLESISDRIIFNVKQKYFALLQSKRNKQVAEETVRQYQQHLEQAKGFFEVGVKPKFDVTKAEVDLGTARLNLIISENALKSAKASLDNAIGIPEAPEYIIEDNLQMEKYTITFDEAISNAYKNRPELKSIISRKEAAAGTVELARKGFYPVLTGNASYNWSGENFPLDNGWNAGITLSFPLFSGFLTKYQVEEAKANLNVQKANEESLRQSIFLEVQQAYLNFKEAEERIPVAELNVKQAQENFEIADGRYAAGVGNPIEVTDASVALTNAKTAYIQALYDYKIAIASLEKAMGVR
jgi:TolC family type I secretion outer membrane protein